MVSANGIEPRRSYSYVIGGNSSPCNQSATEYGYSLPCHIAIAVYHVPFVF